MGEKKIEVSAGWWKKNNATKISHKIENHKAMSIDDLPQTLDKVETGKIIRCGPKHVERIWRNKEMRSFYMNGKRVTTPEYIGEYMLKLMKNG